MSVATAGTGFATNRSLDTSSNQFPDRPIRPLPKRPLRSRLSSDVADSILYPPGPSSTTPLFCFPYGYTESVNSNGGHDATLDEERDSATGVTQDHGQHNGYGERDSMPAFARRPYQGFAQSSHPTQRDGKAGQNNQVRAAGLQQRPSPGKPSAKSNPIPSSASAASSADGYDSFENTNNKKKRKIPTPGSIATHHSHLSTDLANLGISSTDPQPMPTDDAGTAVGQYYGSGNSASSVGLGSVSSLPSRGRFGRGAVRQSSSGRSPLGVTTDGMNAWANGRSRQRAAQWMPGTPKSFQAGQVSGQSSNPGNRVSDGDAPMSAAIANAAENPLTPSQGQENMGLSQQKSLKKSTPTKTQFTFTSPLPVNWPGGSGMVMPAMMGLGGSSVGQSAPQGHYPRTTQGSRQNYSQAPTGGQQNSPQASKPRARRTGKEYALAARQRRLQQEYNNYHHPPSSDEIWICEFCEYESIFGAPPEALVRQYEIKDRRERRRLAEKRRLLEKAKLKGRKNKKGGKAAAKPAGPASQQPSQGVHDQSEVNGVDEPEEELVRASASPPAPAKTSQTPHLDAKSPQAQSSNDVGVKGGGGGGTRARRVAA